MALATLNVVDTMLKVVESEYLIIDCGIMCLLKTLRSMEGCLFSNSQSMSRWVRKDTLEFLRVIDGCPGNWSRFSTETKKGYVLLTFPSIIIMTVHSLKRKDSDGDMQSGEILTTYKMFAATQYNVHPLKPIEWVSKSIRIRRQKSSERV